MLLLLLVCGSDNNVLFCVPWEKPSYGIRFFLSSVEFITYKHWKHKWLLSFSAFIASIFVFVNIFKPEIHSTNLMLALQSYWIIPHVTVYILSYAMFCGSYNCFFYSVK
ncbi:MAG: hypothetical protein LUH22_11205 [Bacteroides sp.]|nr:hypothetical protein [Bacteroides sp.]